ncbi:hypothetical protein ANO11243_058370 [Dothideomycetidae sp. 11243]|nr:hypothetical protein ANO11243_058370 [fungal sp. No.11243]
MLGEESLSLNISHPSCLVLLLGGLKACRRGRPQSFAGCLLRGSDPGKCAMTGEASSSGQPGQFSIANKQTWRPDRLLEPLKDSTKPNPFVDVGAVKKRATGHGQLPPTVSAPDIHYTTTIDARTFVYDNTILFLAHNETFEKRVLHPLRLSDGLSLAEQRPLYLEESMVSHGTTSIIDLLCEKFEDDPASIHLLHLRPAECPELSSAMPALVSLHKELQAMSDNLSFMPPHVGFWATPPALPNWPDGVPRMLVVTKDPSDEGRRWPVVLGGEWLTGLAMNSNHRNRDSG